MNKNPAKIPVDQSLKDKLYSIYIDYLERLPQTARDKITSTAKDEKKRRGYLSDKTAKILDHYSLKRLGATSIEKLLYISYYGVDFEGKNWPWAYHVGEVDILLKTRAGEFPAKLKLRIHVDRKNKGVGVAGGSAHSPFRDKSMAEFVAQEDKSGFLTVNVYETSYKNLMEGLTPNRLKWLKRLISHETAHIFDPSINTGRDENVSEAQRRLTGGKRMRKRDLVHYYNSPAEIKARIAEYTEFMTHEITDWSDTDQFMSFIRTIKYWEFYTQMSPEARKAFLKGMYTEWSKMSVGQEKKTPVRLKLQSLKSKKETKSARFFAAAVFK